MDIRTVNDVYALYELFNNGRLGELVGTFALDATYQQTNTNLTVQGHDQIAEVLTGWGTCFKGAQVTVAQVTPNHLRLDEVPGADSCYEVDFVGRGDYVQDLPGLKDAALATGQSVRLPLHEIVWVQDGKITRVVNRFVPEALAGAA